MLTEVVATASVFVPLLTLETNGFTLTLTARWPLDITRICVKFWWKLVNANWSDRPKLGLNTYLRGDWGGVGRLANVWAMVAGGDVAVDTDFLPSSALEDLVSFTIDGSSSFLDTAANVG